MTNGNAPIYGGQCATGYGHQNNSSYYNEIDTTGTGSKAGLLTSSGSRSWGWVGAFDYNNNYHNIYFRWWSVLCGARAIIVP